MIIELESSYYVSFKLTPEDTWHRYPCKLSKEGKDDFVQRMTEKSIPTQVEEVKNEIALLVGQKIMNKQPTSFRLNPETISLLKELAKDESRSITNMVESLIKEKAKEKSKAEPERLRLEAKLKV